MPDDPLQTAALNALAPFLALAPSATSPRAAADLISQAVAAPGTYVFAELLSQPNVAALQSAEAPFQSWYHALEQFSWGTWGDYEAQQSSTPDSLPKLSTVQEHKLRLLTLLTLVHTPSSLTYAALAPALGLDSPASLEPLLVEALSSGLLVGRLNPAQGRLDVRSAAPLRDVAPGRVPHLISALSEWEQTCGVVLRDVEGQMKRLREAARMRGRKAEAWEAMLDEKIGVPKGAGGKGRGADDELKGGKRDRGEDVGGEVTKRSGKAKR